MACKCVREHARVAEGHVHVHVPPACAYISEQPLSCCTGILPILPAPSTPPSPAHLDARAIPAQHLGGSPQRGQHRLHHRGGWVGRAAVAIGKV